MNGVWTVPTLYYHHISPDIPYYTNVVPQEFERHLSVLADHYRFWTAEQAYRALRSGENPTKRIVLSFDDGYVDNFVHAAPILDRYRIKATFFVLPAFMGTENTWNRKASYRTRHLTWSEAAQLQEAGHEIGSHGLLHRDITRLTPPEIQAELQDSKDLIERNLDKPVTCFAYPYGTHNSLTTGLVRQTYKVSFSTVKSQHRDWSSETHGLRREYIPSYASPAEILRLAASNLAVGGSL